MSPAACAIGSQFAEECFPFEKIFQQVAFVDKARGEIGFFDQGRHGSNRGAGAFDVLQRGVGQGLREVGAALDRFLNVLMGSVERQDCILIIAPANAAHLADGSVDKIDPGKLGAAHRSKHAVKALFVTFNSRPDFRGDRGRSEFLDVIAEGLAIIVASLGNDLEVDALLGPETGGAEQVVACETLLGRGTCCLFDGLPF